MIAATYAVTASEHTAVSRHMLYRGWSYWCLLPILATGPTLLGVFATGRAPEPVVFLPAIGAGLLLWYLVPWFYVVIKRQGVRDIGGPQTVTFSDASVATEYAHGRAELKWSAFVRALETRAHVLLYMGSGALFVPKRALTEHQLGALRQLLVAKLGDHAQLRR